MANEFIARKGLISSGSINVSGSVTASYFKGDGSQLTNLPATTVLSSSVNIDTYTFPADGSTVDYLLSQSYNINSLLVTVDGLTQISNSDYTLSGSTLTFTNVPPSASNILVKAFVNVTQNVTGSFSGSFFGIVQSSSYAQTASYALNAQSGGSGAGFPFSGSAVITGSLQVVPTGSVGGITGSVSGALTGTFPYSGLTGTPSGIVSSSGQVDYTGLSNIPSGIVSSSTQTKANLPNGTVSSSAQYPGWVTSSTQVDYTQLQNIPQNIVSSSAQVKTFLPDGTVSSSTQVTVDLPNGVVSSSAQYPGWVTSSTQVVWSQVNYNTGIVSSSGQVQADLPAGTVSSSAQYPGWVTSSAQVNTGSFTGSFIGNFSATTVAKISSSLGLHITTDTDLSGLSSNTTYLFTSGSDTAYGSDLYIRRDNHLTKWDWIEQQLSTGLLFGGVLSYSGSQLYISSGSGIIVNYGQNTASLVDASITYVSWGHTTQSATYRTTDHATYVYVDNVGVINQQNTPFTLSQYGQAIPLGRYNHADRNTITGISNDRYVAYGQSNQALDFIKSIGPVKIDGLTISGQSGTLRLNVGTGTAYSVGGFYQVDPQNVSHYDIPAYLTASMARVYLSGSDHTFDTNGTNFYTVLDPTKYALGDGTLGNVGINNWSIQRAFLNPTSGRVAVYYGQTTYTTLDSAIANLSTDTFTESTFTSKEFVFIGYLVVKGNTTDLTSVNNRIIQSGLFRNSIGSSGATVYGNTLDGLSDVTITTPQSGQALVYNGGSWINGTPSSASFATTASAATSITFTPISASYAISSSYVPSSVIDVRNTTGIETLATTGSNTFVGNQIISGSLTTNNSINAVTISASNGLFVNNGGITTTDGIIANTVSASFSGSGANIFGVNYTTLTNIPSGIVSSSTQTKANLPDGTVSSSAQYPGWVTASSQIDYNNITNKLSGVVSSSTQIQPLLPNGTVSSSAQYPGWITASSQIQLNSITGTTFANTDFNFPQNLTVVGTLTANQFNIQSASIIYTSGSTKFGDTADDTHQFTGSLSVLGSISGALILPAGTVSSSGQYPGWVTSSTQIVWSSVNYNTGIVSSSGQVTSLLPTGTVSASSQIDYNSIQNKLSGVVSSSTQVQPLLPNGTVSSSAQYPGWVTASSQIDYNSIQNKLSGVVSSSTQVQPLLPANTVSSSTQVVAFLPTGTVSSSTQINTGSFSGSITTASYVLPSGLPAGTVSSSGQVSYTGLTNIPSGIVSSSNQVQTLLPNGTVSSSAQYPGWVTASSQVDYNSIQNKLSGVISSSAQFNALTGTSASFASTASYVNTLDQSVSASGNIAAGVNLISNYSAGDEGGEILLAKPQTNTTLTGSGVTIDVYQNKLRIFEQGGNARGGYFDITGLAASVGTNLAGGAGTVTSITAGSGLTGGTITGAGTITVDTGSTHFSSGVTKVLPAGTVSSSTQQVVATYTNGVDNRVLTATSTNGINAESTLTYDGTVLSISTNGAKYFQGGDDAALYDVNVANTIGIHGQQDSTVGAIKLGSAGQTIYSNATGIGIGTTAPAALLHVQGNVSASSFTGSFNGAHTGSILSPGVVSSSAQYPGWVTSSTQIVWSSVNYNTGIVSSSTQVQPLLPGGTVSSSAQYPGWVTASNQIDYNSITNKLSGVYSSSTQVVAAIAGQTIAPSTINATGAYSGSTGTFSGNITALSLTETSTVTLKDNIRPLEPQLSIIQTLRPSRFQWKNSHKEDIGLIAEWVDTIYPELVDKDDEGNPIGIHYTKLTVVLIKAVQELTEEVNRLKKTE